MKHSMGSPWQIQKACPALVDGIHILQMESESAYMSTLVPDAETACSVLATLNHTCHVLGYSSRVTVKGLRTKAQHSIRPSNKWVQDN